MRTSEGGGTKVREIRTDQGQTKSKQCSVQDFSLKKKFNLVSCDFSVHQNLASILNNFARDPTHLLFTLYTCPPSPYPIKLFSDIMAAQFGSFGQLPPELQLTVWSLALVPSPGVHFVRPNSHHNGSILGPASENYQIEYGPGISEVSYLSASCEHARLRMVSQDARGRLLFPNGREPITYSRLSAVSAASEPVIWLSYQQSTHFSCEDLQMGLFTNPTLQKRYKR